MARTTSKDAGEWVDGFLFVANRPILDFVNTKPVLAEGPTELLPDFLALERWLIAAGVADSTKTKNLLRNWRNAPEAQAFLKELLAFRERLRGAALRLEAGATPSDEFLKEVNARLLEYPVRATLRKRDGRISMAPVFEPERPRDLWAPFIHGTAELLSETQTERLRKCESCVLHFFDTSKKGSRRWCSMNLCGNKVKVAAYQRRRRDRDSR